MKDCIVLYFLAKIVKGECNAKRSLIIFVFQNRILSYCKIVKDKWRDK